MRRRHATTRGEECQAQATVRAHQGIGQEARQEHEARERDRGANREQAARTGWTDEVAIEIEVETLELDQEALSLRLLEEVKLMGTLTAVGAGGAPECR